MSSTVLSASRTALRPLSQHSQQLARLFSTNTRPRVLAASTSMNTGVIFASAAVAASAYYVLYARGHHTAQAEMPGGNPTFASFGFNKLKLASTVDVNHDVKRLSFDLGNPQTPTGLSLTSALLTITFPGGGWIPVVRPYTPVNIEQNGHIDLLVKKYPGGKQSSYLHGLQPGDSVTFFRVPGYSYKVNEQKHIGLVAGGQGITPCYQLLRGILLNPDDHTRITLVWGANTDEDVMLRDELAKLQQTYPGRLEVKVVVSRPATGSPYPQGRVTKELLSEVGITSGSGMGKVFMSGPPGMEKAFGGRSGVLSQLGFGKAQMHTF